MTDSRLRPAATLDKPDPTGAREAKQYSLGRILGIWAATTIPMASLAWLVWPLLRNATDLNAGMLFWLLMVAGMVWQFVLSLIVLRRELGTLRWSVVAPRIWAQQPRNPRTGLQSPRSWWALVPITIVFAALTFASELLGPVFDALGWVAPQGTDARQLASPEFVGQWWILGVAVVSFALNHLLGEELLFRGVLPPKMRGAFGKWDWFMNNVLFAAYHLHKIWALPHDLVLDHPPQHRRHRPDRHGLRGGQPDLLLLSDFRRGDPRVVRDRRSMDPRDRRDHRAASIPLGRPTRHLVRFAAGRVASHARRQRCQRSLLRRLTTR
ncbi:CPBP family intramembrane glutamic endopeptidase [Microbacterium sp.]|uniref:CPBP family intramembrane glutamic endopeptidase n=1 Tax=Microbacterium sp. TaxID=51671 RepID=UPI0039E4C299